MASGTGNLPYPGKSYTPFDILTAEELNEDVANIESLATGTGIGDGSIATAALANASVTAPKIDFTTLHVGAGRSYVATLQTTTSSSYTNLATTQSIAVTIGASGKLLVGLNAANVQHSNQHGQSYVSFALSGANTVSAGGNTVEGLFQAYTAGGAGGIGVTALLTGLTPGNTTVTMVFRTPSGTASFGSRLLWALPL